ncbi:MAG: hypothetical protein WCG95_01815 [bacterium]
MENLKTVGDLLAYLSALELVYEVVGEREIKLYLVEGRQGIIYALKLEDEAGDLYLIHQKTKDHYGIQFSFIVTYTDDLFLCDEIEYKEETIDAPEPKINDLIKAIIKKFPNLRMIEADFDAGFDDFSSLMESLKFQKDELVRELIELRFKYKKLQKDFQQEINEKFDFKSNWENAENSSDHFRKSSERNFQIVNKYLSKVEPFKDLRDFYNKIMEAYYNDSTIKNDYKYEGEVYFLIDPNKIILKTAEAIYSEGIPMGSYPNYYLLDATKDAISEYDIRGEIEDLNFSLTWSEFEQIFK